MSYVYGTEFDDILKGTCRNDKIIGQQGDDLILGKGGNDKIFGDAGEDVLVGGRGKDTFHFVIQDGQYGPVVDAVDRIMDFTPGKDRLAIYSSTNGVVTYDKVSGSLTFDRDGPGGIEGVVFAKISKYLTIHDGDLAI